MCGWCGGWGCLGIEGRGEARSHVVRTLDFTLDEMKNRGFRTEQAPHMV